MVFVLLGCPLPKAKKKMPRIFALSYSMEAGREPSFLITDDFNRNHMLDLVVVNSGDHTFHFIKETGMGLLRINVFLGLAETPFVWFRQISMMMVTRISGYSIMLTRPSRYI